MAFHQFRQCSRCVLDDVEVPDIVFDSEGVCQYCRVWTEKERERKTEATNLPWRLHEIRKSGTGSGKEYDVVLGLSGGVDSSYSLHLLKQNDLKILCWSLDNGWNDKKADENIMRMVEKLNVPFIRKVIDLEQFKELQSAYLKAGIKNIEAAYDHILWALNYDVAEEYGVKVIADGGNHWTEGVMPPAYGHDAKDRGSVRGIYKMTTGKTLTLPTQGVLRYLHRRFLKGIRVFQILNYVEYRKKDAIALLEREYGWIPYGEKHCENVWTWWFQHWYLPVKWKLDKRKPHYSSLINSGQMTRQEAVRKLIEPLTYPSLGIEEKVMRYPKKNHLDYPNDGWKWEALRRLYGLRPKRK